jgi:hypothetical protein
VSDLDGSGLAAASAFDLQRTVIDDFPRHRPGGTAASTASLENEAARSQYRGAKIHCRPACSTSGIRPPFEDSRHSLHHPVRRQRSLDSGARQLHRELGGASPRHGGESAANRDGKECPDRNRMSLARLRHIAPAALDRANAELRPAVVKAPAGSSRSRRA